KHDLARMERALGQLMLDVHTREHGYTEVAPPLLVRDQVMFGTAQLPKFTSDQFPIGEGDQFQIAAASFEELMAKVISRAPERIAAVQEESRRLTGREMTPEELLSTFIAGLEAGIPEYREIYETKTGQPSRLWLIPTAEVPLTNLVREQ